MRTAFVALMVTVLICAPPVLGAQSTDASCASVEQDSARFGLQPVYRECAVSKPARSRKAVDPEFVAEGGLTCAVAKLEVVVNEKGAVNPVSARVLNTNSATFAAALIKSLEKWRFSPAELDKRKVSQLFELDHSMRATDALGRTAYVVGRAGNGTTMRPQPGVGSAPCEP